MKDQGTSDVFQTNSAFIKLAILPKNIPIGDIQASKSVRDQNETLFFLEKKSEEITIPSKPPWNYIPPFQTIIISTGF